MYRVRAVHDGHKMCQVQKGKAWRFKKKDTCLELAKMPLCGDVAGTVASESALRSAGTLLSQVRATPLAPWPDGGLESLKSP
ncbi:hypothetical protein PoB_005279900 [Plakobranchus ocellatus]|uniref:Uncharacterized protein n=1 Tax=Plakobranchus ocellatus TaxID=259542 RepID=A0AAV4C6I8_9GAST|nr:hypothetical protein PoB_005279900 [Plakobranchus ocellatus]